jgi:hypothetical protein
MAFTIVTQGTFTQPATAQTLYVPLPSGVDYFKTINYTQMGLAPTPGVNVMGEWFGGGITADNDGIRWSKTTGTNALTATLYSTATASNGFTYVRDYPAPQAALTGTTITAANPAVASVVNTYSNGDQVTIYNAVGMQQISGMTFTISSVSGTGFTLLGLNASAFATAATSFQVRKIAPAMPVQPQYYYITGITQAAQGVVTVSQAHNYVVGECVEFQIPASCGMVQLNNFNQAQSKPPIITAITTYTFTINVNTTGYTAFALPLSTLSPTAQLFATVAPQGQNAAFNPITGVQTGYNFLQVPFHSALFLPYMLLPSGANSPGGVAGDQIIWQAFKMETGTINAPVPS